jgi:predicted nucleic acid-binding protein
VIVLDTNVLSEVLRPYPTAAALRWLEEQEPGAVFTTSITAAEILYGVEVLPSGKRRTALLSACEKILYEEFAGRILPFDEAAGRIYPKIAAGRRAAGLPISQFDAMIAAIARSQRAALATRNTDDFVECGLRLIDPWRCTPQQ